MDPRLAEIYGTNEDIGDVEKTAAAELAEKLAEENGMDIDNMTAEDIEALAAEVLSEDAGYESDDSDEAGEKLAEADYIGRVMAHAYVQELREIEKTAAYTPSKEEMARARKMSKHVPLLQRASGPVRRFATRSANRLRKGRDKAVELAVKHPKSALGLGALGAAGAGFAAGRKTKKSSATPALDALAQARAEELLAENGADQWDVLSSAVDQRALEMLAEAGYDVE